MCVVARPVRWLLAALLAAVLLSGCSGGVNLPGTTNAQRDGARAAATALVDAMNAGKLTGLAVAGTTAAEADRQFTRETADLGARLTAAVQNVDVNGSSASATLTVAWTFPGVEQPWSYASTAVFTDAGSGWQTNWAPTIVHPDLQGDARLVADRVQGERGDILGAGGTKLMTRRPVVRIGIDKTQVDAADQPASARALARLLDIDTDRYAAAVKAAGARAFVEALTLRASSDDRPTGTQLNKIAGARAIESTAVLAPSRDFARAILGSVGSATQEVVQKSQGAIAGGDQVGLSGLQQRYDAQLRGTPGVTVTIAAGTSTGTGTASPSPSADPSPSATPAPALFTVAATDGKPLTVTLDATLQSDAEEVLADVDPASAIVAIRPSSGEVLAAASGPGSKGQNTATVGQYPPGSTFKVASALALLRAGLTPDSKVSCPATTTVDGRTFKNYDDYPSGELGTITLRTALAQSCNTAFVTSRGKLGDGDLAAAAASLGLGTDYDVGFPAYFGAVPTPDGETGRAAAMFGQGTVEASPLAMAAVAASVAHGGTVVPHMVDGQQPDSKAKPLTTEEARQLRSMMGAVVSEGPGRFLQDLEPPTVIAKTGTAEYGSGANPPTHAWMIGAQGDLAVAVFVAEGDSGSKTAGPLLEELLRQAR